MSLRKPESAEDIVGWGCSGGEYGAYVISPVYVPPPPPPPFQARQPAEPANRQLGSGQSVVRSLASGFEHRR